MSKRKVFQLNSELFKVTGIQRVLLDIHEALQDDFDAKIVGTIPYDKVDTTLGIAKADYHKMSSPLMFRNSVVIIHERRYLPFMWLLTHTPDLNIKCIYVHHNELWGNKLLSLFPKNVVAISDAGIKNLTDYFKIPLKNITKIHNCYRESKSHGNIHRTYNPDSITVIYPARINAVKRQLEIYRHLKDQLDKRVRILFAGTGPDYEELRKITENDNQFQALGFREDVVNLMNESDYMMLFSTTEGLPISLIEGCSTGLPLICNNVGGNYEIARKGLNLLEVHDWESLLKVLNSLPNITQEEYLLMSKNSRQIYESYFTSDVFKANYINLINSLYKQD